MSKIILFFTQLQAQIKYYHWMTKSHPRHLASDKLHSALEEHIDKFVEVYLGKYNRRGATLPSGGASVVLKTLDDRKIETFLQKAIDYLTNDLPKQLDAKKDTDLLNLRDEILVDINQALYLFSLR
jgi:hypothetical protein